VPGKPLRTRAARRAGRAPGAGEADESGRARDEPAGLKLGVCGAEAVVAFLQDAVLGRELRCAGSAREKAGGGEEEEDGSERNLFFLPRLP
jgi:hypothetical protein